MPGAAAAERSAGRLLAPAHAVDRGGGLVTGGGHRALPARTVHRDCGVEGIRVFYRGSLPEVPDAPVLLRAEKTSANCRHRPLRIGRPCAKSLP
ncbi:hypothetical protein ACN3XK_03525 [Actinomadura welshii]